MPHRPRDYILDDDDGDDDDCDDDDGEADDDDDDDDANPSKKYTQVMPRSRGLRKCNAVFAIKVVAKYETKDFLFFIPIGRKGMNPRKLFLFGIAQHIDFDTF